MAKKYSLQDSFEWLGEFWFEAEPDNHFPGILSYSPTAGVKLSTLREGMTQTGGETTEGGHTIHGHTIETGKITLLICHPQGNGVSNNTNTKEDFFGRAAVIGHHISTDDKVSGCTFSLTNLDEFFRPSSQSLGENFSRTPILQYKNDDEIWSVGMNGVGVLTSFNKVSPLLMLGGENSNNSVFAQKLDECYAALIKEYKIKNIYAKKKLVYEVNIESKNVDFFDYINKLNSTVSLFTLLMLRQISLTQLSLAFGDGQEKRCFPVLLSQWLTEKQARISNEAHHHFLMPVNINGVKDVFESMLKTWMEFQQNKLNLVYPVLIEHIKNEYDITAHCALLISALEQWYSEEKPDNKAITDKKYDWPINQYCTEEMKSYLCTILPGNEKRTLGDRLSLVRAAMLHPSSKKNINTISLHNIAEMVFIMLIVGLYKKLGISEITIEKIQEKYPHGIREHRSF